MSEAVTTIIGDEPAGLEPVMAWVSSSDVEECWHPEYFSPEYKVIDETLRDPAVNKLRLEQVLTMMPREQASGGVVDVKWVAIPRMGSITIREEAVGDLTGATIISRPSVIVGRNITKGLPVAYYGDDVFQGAAAVAQDLLVLSPKADYDPAWLVAEMQSQFFQLQVMRSTAGSSVPHVSSEQLLRLWVRVPPEEEQRRLGERVRQRLAIEHAKSAIEAAQREQPPLVITGATFEERLRQFEEYLLSQPWVDTEAAFFVEASTKDPRSDLFVVRPLAAVGDQGQQLRHGTQLRPQDDRERAKVWREWYWNTEEQWRIYNALVGVDDLPPFLLARMANIFAGPPPAGGVGVSILPGFGVWRDIVESHRAAAGEEGLGPETWKQLIWEWLAVASLQGGQTSEEDSKGSTVGEPEETAAFSEWLRTLHRPALVLKVLRDGQVIGAYVVFGRDQADNPQGVRTQLEGYGTSLRDTLGLTPEAVADAARRESLRRLSTFSHSLGGPMLRITSVLEDLEGLLESRQELERELIPNKTVAERRAKMPGRSLEEYTFGARLRVLRQALGEMKNVADQIKRLKRVEGELKLGLIDVVDLLSDRAHHCRSHLEYLEIDAGGITGPVLTMADYEALTAAIDQVLSNACREMKERKVGRPRLKIRVEVSGRTVVLGVEDNGLPADTSLIKNPFAEDSSSYFRAGKGSGFGLVIVRQVFRSLGGNCTLRENYADGERVEGVTFEARFPLHRPPGGK
jgi:signal transduction histidine kinase